MRNKLIYGINIYFLDYLSKGGSILLGRHEKDYWIVGGKICLMFFFSANLYAIGGGGAQYVSISHISVNRNGLWCENIFSFIVYVTKKLI
jgi:hypothetical protein